MSIAYTAKECAVATQIMLRRHGVFVHARLVRLIVFNVFSALAVRGAVRVQMGLQSYLSRSARTHDRACRRYRLEMAAVYNPAFMARLEARRKAAEARRRAYRRPVRLGRHRLFSLREFREAVALEQDLKESVSRAGTEEDRHRAELRVVVLSKAIRVCRPGPGDSDLEATTEDLAGSPETRAEPRGAVPLPLQVPEAMAMHPPE